MCVSESFLVEDGQESLETGEKLEGYCKVLARDSESLGHRHEEGTDVRYSGD